MKRNSNASSIKDILAAVLALSLCFASAGAHAGGYPDHQIRMVVPYGPGGVTDIIARAVAPAIAQALGGSIFVDNRPGGSTMIGTELMVRSKPDGYTILFDSGAALAAKKLWRSPGSAGVAVTV